MGRTSADPHGKQPIIEQGRPLKTAAGAVVLLHGRGASAEDILGLAKEFALPELAYLAPEAAGNAWYPYSFLAAIEDNQPWLDSALKVVERTIAKAAAAGIPQERIAVAGFSQGACLATEFAAKHASRYGGVIAFTGGLIGPAQTKFHYAGKLGGTPCFLGAGDRDPHVPWERVQESAAVLSALGGNVTLKKYPGLPHTINQDEIDHARQILSTLTA